MSIKSDKWIRQMAQKHGMIEPFEPGKSASVTVKKLSVTEPAATATIFAAPLEFKVFTNIHSTVVDPKNFDEKVLSILSQRCLHHPAQ